MTDTLSRLIVVLSRGRTLPAVPLQPELALEALGIDSLGLVEVLWDVEEDFAIKLPRKIPALLTLGDVVRYVDLLTLQQHGPIGTAAATAASPGPA